MPDADLRGVLDYLQKISRHKNLVQASDGHLLEAFISGREEAAFRALVRRHGPMVMGVCLRVLRNRHDAEDAFQATFLVLARKAARISTRKLLANWLYGVAFKTSLKAQAANCKRRTRERQVTPMPEPEMAHEELWTDLQPVLDAELSRLPEKYRIPIILCDLEGKTGKQAARQLGCPEGTLTGRLTRARQMLAKRLKKRGIEFTGIALVTCLSQQTTSAAVPVSLITATAKAATLLVAGHSAAVGIVSARVVALTQGVLKAMLLTKLKTGAGVFLVAAVVGMAAVNWQLGAGTENALGTNALLPAVAQADPGASQTTKREQTKDIPPLPPPLPIPSEHQLKKLVDPQPVPIPGFDLPIPQIPSPSAARNYSLAVKLTDSGPGDFKVTYQGQIFVPAGKANGLPLVKKDTVKMAGVSIPTGIALDCVITPVGASFRLDVCCHDNRAVVNDEKEIVVQGTTLRGIQQITAEELMKLSSPKNADGVQRTLEISIQNVEIPPVPYPGNPPPLPPAPTTQTKSFELKKMPAAAAAKILRERFNFEPIPDPGMARVRIALDEMTNTIHVTASPLDMLVIEDMIPLLETGIAGPPSIPKY